MNRIVNVVLAVVALLAITKPANASTIPLNAIQIVNAIESNGLVNYVDWSDHHFALFGTPGREFYGPSPFDPSFSFDVSHIRHATLSGRRVAVFAFQNSADPRMGRSFAIFETGLAFAGVLPGGLRDSSWRVVGDTLNVTQQGRTIATLRVNADGLYEARPANPGGIFLIQLAEIGGVKYGRPSDVRAITKTLTERCPSAAASELIQVGGYALAGGSCGPVELHAALAKSNGSWQLVRCGWGGGDVPNPTLYDALVHRCNFSSSTARRIISIRIQTRAATAIPHR